LLYLTRCVEGMGTVFTWYSYHIKNLPPFQLERVCKTMDFVGQFSHSYSQLHLTHAYVMLGILSHRLMYAPSGVV